MTVEAGSAIRLGLRENLAQISLLVVVNAFVGAMIGMERSILPAIAEQDFQLAARTAVLSFIVVFGVTKALTNYLAGRLSDRFGRSTCSRLTPTTPKGIGSVPFRSRSGAHRNSGSDESIRRGSTISTR